MINKSFNSKISGYLLSTIICLMIIVSLIITVILLGELNPVIAAIGGLLFTIPIRFFWLTYMSPILIIKKEVNGIELPEKYKGRYVFSRIVVENKGKSAAKNCKGNIVFGEATERKLRVCWTVPNSQGERSTTTINAKDNESLDFCAFCTVISPIKEPIIRASVAQRHDTREIKLPKIIAPTEWGWPEEVEKSRKLDDLLKQRCYVLITAENTNPVIIPISFIIDENKIKIDF